MYHRKASTQCWKPGPSPQRHIKSTSPSSTTAQPHTSKPDKQHKKYPYLLRGLDINQPNLVWVADITYVPMPLGFMYLVAIMDRFSRFVVAWQLSNTLDGAFCLEALRLALWHGQPEIFNTDQGVQFTARDFTGELEAEGIRISMDGRGRVFITSSLSGSGAGSSTRTSISRSTLWCLTRLPDSTTTSNSTTTSGRTKASATVRPLTFILLLRCLSCDPLIHLILADLS